MSLKASSNSKTTSSFRPKRKMYMPSVLPMTLQRFDKSWMVLLLFWVVLACTETLNNILVTYQLPRISVRIWRSHHFIPWNRQVIHAWIPKLCLARVTREGSVSIIKPCERADRSPVTRILASLKICKERLQRWVWESGEVYRQLLLIPVLLHPAHLLLLPSQLLSKVSVLQEPPREV